MGDKVHHEEGVWPIVGAKGHEAPSVFRPEALLREARRQRRLPLAAVPEICVLDPDGDVVRHLKRTGVGRVHEGWACYHTEHVTNSMAQSAGDFEKGEADGAEATIAVVAVAAG